MTGALLNLAQLTVREPREGMRQILGLNLKREVLWPAMIVVVALNAVLYNVALFAAPPPPGAVLLLPTSPFVLALVTAAVLILTVFSLHYIGRMFDGSGTFEGALAVVIWLQCLMLMAQVAQIVLLFASPFVGNLFGLGVGIFAIWLFVNFVAELHGFRSLALVLAGIVVSGFGVLFGVSVLMAIVSVLLGVDFQNV